MIQIHHVKERFRFHRDRAAKLGVLGWLTLYGILRFPRAARWIPRLLWTKDTNSWLAYRPGTSDLDVYQQIFVEKQYHAIPGPEVTGLVLDCGANVGYSSALFLSQWPQATVIAIEPDPDNYRILCQNVERFGTRVRTVLGAVWSRSCGLVLDRGSYRDGRDWAVRARPGEPGEAVDVPALDILSLLRIAGYQRISFLKMDVEAAEIEIFGKDCQEWLNVCDAIAIELHDRQCEEVFRVAIARQHFQTSCRGEITVCLRERQ